MSKSRAVVCAWFVAVLCCATAYAQTPDRVIGDLAAGPKVQLKGNVHGLARPEFDLGRADGSQFIESITLSLAPSAAQQQDLQNFLAQLGHPHSKNFHKYLTPEQFGERFGMSQNDLDKITAWLEKQGFTNISVANGRNQISFDGTISQIESAFAMEMHHYLVNNEVHLANSGEPSVPAPLAGIVRSLWHINDFSPKPRVTVKPNLTSYVSGNHFLTPGDFAKIYDLGSLYTAGGSGQKIAIVGQSTVSTTDLNNFRSAAGLPASTVTMTLVGGTQTRCSGDEGESDLDLEWSGGVAQNASVTFVYAGVDSGKTCTSRINNVWNALQYVIQNNVAPFVSTSYGYCESGLGQAFVDTLQGWAQQGQTQGQTIVSASGDSGAADCEPSTSTSATTGLAVDAPASIPEVTGAGGNEFFGDSAATVTGTPPNTSAGATTYWGASGTGSDVVVTALGYIPEETWNDTTESIAAGFGLAASGGGASIYFAKPTWQTGTGVPTGGNRDVPDISVTTSNFHDPYLICSEDNPNTGGIVQTCTAGFRTGTGGGFSAVGGTSAAAPTLTAILALINQSLSNSGSTGLAPVNPMLYSLWASTPTAFHDVTQGDNKVPCTAGTTNCPTGTTTIGFSAGTGYDQVTGIGSPDVTNLANAWAAALSQYAVTASALTPASVSAGSSTMATVTVTPNTGSGFSGAVDFSCSGLPSGATCSFNPASVTGGSGTTTLTIQTAANTPAGTSTVTVVGTSGSESSSATVSLAVVRPTFALTAGALNPASTPAGQSTSSTITVTPQNGFTDAVTFVPSSCMGLPAGASCSFNPAIVSGGSGTTILTIQTAGNMATGTTNVTVTATSGSLSESTAVGLVVSATTMSFSLSPNVSKLSLTAGQSGATNITVTSTGTPSFVQNTGSASSTVLPLTYSCSGLPSGATCNFGPGSTSSGATVTLAVATLPSMPNTSAPITINATTGGSSPLMSATEVTVNVTQIDQVSALVSSLNPSNFGQTVTFTATVTTGGPNAPTGIISFKDAATTLGNGMLNSSGVATFATSSLAAGQHSIVATYSGDTNDAPSTSAVLTQIVNPSTTTTALASSSNPVVAGSTVTFTATVTTTGPNMPTGAVTFVDGSTTLGSGALNGSGVAAFATSSLTVGQHSVTSMYGGDTDNAASTSAVFNQTVKAPDFALSSTPGAVTVSAGNSVGITVTVTPQGSFSNTISFTCSGLPGLASCLFNPSTITPNTNATATSLTITTAARNTSMALPPPFGRRSLPAYAIWCVLSAILLTATRVPTHRRRMTLTFVFAFLVSSSLLLQTACGGSGSSSTGGAGNGSAGGTPAGTYSITITGAAASIQHATTVTLTVQ